MPRRGASDAQSAHIRATCPLLMCKVGEGGPAESMQDGMSSGSACLAVWQPIYKAFVCPQDVK
eukprot:364627-Chlamydomonas_euryale.AAC.3